MNEPDNILLLVEDDDDEVARIVQAVTDAPPRWPRYDVRRVHDLHGAIDLLETVEVTCALLDMDLPDATDTQGLSHLRRSKPTLPIVAMTGDDDPETARKVLHHGAQEAVAKTSARSPELLARTIDQAVARAAAQQTRVESHGELASFSAMVAHDLRNPLSVASGMLELLQRKAGDELPDTLNGLVDRSVGAIRRASDLVQSLLEYAQSTRPDEPREAVDLSAVAAWAIDAAGVEQAGGSAVVDDDLPTVVAGEAGMRQVLRNLMTNAVSYADPERSAQIRVSAAEDGSFWTICVTDNGSGIPEESRRAAFVEGERLGRGGDGLGLGLAAVKATIARYGGDVRIEDAPDGPGTTVAFTIPITAV